MNSAHIHLVLNHFPVIGTIFAIILICYGLLRRSEDVIRASLITLIFAGLVAIPVYLTGEPAEEIIEKLPGVSETIIEQHEGLAKFALGTTILTGAAALIAVILSFWSEKKATWLTIATLFLALISGGWLLRTANIGGQIRHSEIRDGATTQTQQQPETEKGEDDDDH